MVQEQAHPHRLILHHLKISKCTKFVKPNGKHSMEARLNEITQKVNDANMEGDVGIMRWEALNN